MKFIYDIHSKKTFGFYLSNVTLVFRSSCREEFWEKCVLRNTCPLVWTSETFVKSVNTYEVPCNLTLRVTLLKMKFLSYFSVIFLISFRNSCFFSEHFLVTVHLLLCFINFCSCWNIDFFPVSFFLFLTLFWLKRHYIGFFENAVVYYFMRSTCMNMFPANWRSLSHFDKNWALPFRKMKNIPVHPPHRQNISK